MGDKIKTRDTTIDFAKGFAILLMLYDHIKSSGWFISSFHMPLFFILSGYLWKDEPFLVIVKKRAKSLLIPYVVFDMIALVVGVIKFTFYTKLPKEEIKIYAWAKFKGMFFGIDVWICWFFLAMFFAVVIYAAIKSISKNNTWLRYLLVILSCILGFVHIYVLSFKFMYFDLALISVLFLAVGDEAKRLNIKNISGELKAFLLLLSGFIWAYCLYDAHLVMAMRVFQKAPLCLLGAIGATYIVVWLSKFARKIPFLGKAVIWCGMNTLPIMCMGNLTRQFSIWADHFPGHSYLYMFIVQLIVIMPIVYIYTVISKKIKMRHGK